MSSIWNRPTRSGAGPSPVLRVTVASTALGGAAQVVSVVTPGGPAGPGAQRVLRMAGLVAR